MSDPTPIPSSTASATPAASPASVTPPATPPSTSSVPLVSGTPPSSAHVAGITLLGNAGTDGSASDAGAGKDGNATDTKTTSSAAPEKYEFTLPEELTKAGVTVDSGMVDAMSPILRELGLTNEQANKLAAAYAKHSSDSVVSAQQAAMDQARTTIDAWQKEVLAWPRAQETLAMTKQAVLKYGGQELAQKFFEDPYLGTNPTVLRLLANMSARLTEDRMQDRAPSAEVSRRDAATIMFDGK